MPGARFWADCWADAWNWSRLTGPFEAFGRSLFRSKNAVPGLPGFE